VTTGLGAEITLGGTAGTVTIVLSATTTAAYTFTRAACDLELVDGSTNIVPILEAPVRLDREVTA
jgi:hypothetical protein